MALGLILLLIFSSQIVFTHSEFVSGNIQDNITFYYRELSVAPSISTIIDFSVPYPRSPFRYQDHHYPLIGIYTDYPKINIEKRCSYIRYGQFRNDFLHPHLRLGENRAITCMLSGTDTVNCRGQIKIQDYIPWNFELTFGFGCDWPRIYSLQGLTYNISFTKQSNDTNNCIKYSEKFHPNACTRFYNEIALPNLFGEYSLDLLIKTFDVYKAYETAFNLDGRCYKHFEDFACRIIFPKCDPFTKQVIHPCREMCWDLKAACLQKWLSMATDLNSKFFWKGAYLLGNWSMEIDCDYLPSLHSSIPCFYKPVTCDSPPDVTNGTKILNATQKDVYQLHEVVQYACVNDTFNMIGNSSISCLHSGHWTHPPPRCSHQNNLHPLVVVLPVLVMPLLVFLVRVIWTKVKRKRMPVLSRARDFDAFICYKFDTDYDYAVNHIANTLEEMCEPPLKLCFHERDFLPGLHIKENIKDAITNSNSAIIVMSQAFIDSSWCQEEFAHCYLEHMKDPAFRIFMIMMQPSECLDNPSEYMQRFIDSRTYLSKYDPKLFQKIVSYLHWVKLPIDKKNRKPPRFEDVKAFLNKQDLKDYMTDTEIEVEFVPSDPFLSVGNDDEYINNDEPNDVNQNDDYTADVTTNCQIEVEVHHSGW